VTSTLAPVGQLAIALLRPIVTVALLTLAVGAIYRWVPIERPTLADIRPPALLTAVAIWLATELFGLIAPLLVQQLAVFGVFVSLLGLLIWLSWLTQLLLLGGSWSRVRRDSRLEVSPDASRSDGRSEPTPRAADHS
jgi:uncharacterized BrkB/YihY/UPF0761 family membrane protein